MLYTPLISQAPRWSGLARQFNSVLHQASTGSASACGHRLAPLPRSPCPLRAHQDGQWRTCNGRDGHPKVPLTRTFTVPAQVARPRDPALQAGSRGFESHRLHRKSPGQRVGVGPVVSVRRSLTAKLTAKLSRILIQPPDPWRPLLARRHQASSARTCRLSVGSWSDQALPAPSSMGRLR